MVFLGIYSAIYDYAPQGENELEIQEGDLLYVIEKSADDDWWKAKKKARDGDDEEPMGLIPNNYVEEAKPAHFAKALYDYTRQTDEELSFTEDATLSVYDTSDPDWTLVGLNGEFGFVPSNYIEISDAKASPAPHPAMPSRPQHPEEEAQTLTPSSGGSPDPSPAAALAGIIQRQSSASATAPAIASPRAPRRPQYTPEASDEEPPSPPAPSLPQRPPSQQLPPIRTQHAEALSPISPGVVESPPYNRLARKDSDSALAPARGGYHLYNINEMMSAMGKKKKLPTTLGINIATGTIMISPEKSRDGPQQEWTAEKLTHYSLEGKHVFMELVRPSRSIDFHAGAKDTANEIVSALGEVAGAARAEGLREVLAVGSGNLQKKGQILYDFLAQGEDEVTVGIGDEVIVIDDTKSEEWWMVRRLKNGKEGVVPSSYVEVTGTLPMTSSSTGGINAGLSLVEQSRLEEERLARDAVRSSRARGDSDPRVSEVGPGLKLPKRESSLMRVNDDNNRFSQRSKRESRANGSVPSSSKPKPDATKTRTWTDRSGSFKVEAEFIGLKDGKIHLHKLNGVKIAVPVPKMSLADLEYVERMTGVSLDDDKPLSDARRRSTQPTRANAGASVEPSKGPEYDWFDFFLKCGVGPNLCERYASNFTRDSMDETVLPDISPSVLRTLGLKEGDILRVMKFLDNKYGRLPNRTKRNVSFGGAEVMGNGEEGDDGTGAANGAGGGLFSGPGGALRNNTRKGRPAPAVQTNDVVNAKAFEQKSTGEGSQRPELSDSRATPLTSVPAPKKPTGGFDDDAWNVKPNRQQPAPTTEPAAPAAPSNPPAPPSQPALTGSLQELSLLSTPLQPTVAQPTGPQVTSPPQLTGQPQVPPTQAVPPQMSQQPQVTGANPSFFSQLGPQQSGPGQFQQNAQPQGPQPNFVPQPTGFALPQSPPQQQPPQQMTMPPRQRPQAPPSVPSQGSLMPPPPPPSRPLSAPQNIPQQSGFGPPPIQPQLTGYQNQSAFQPHVAPPGQSLNELNQQRFQPAQVTGFGQQPSGFSQMSNGINPQPTGFGQQPPQSAFGQTQQQQPQPTGFQPQPTGFQAQSFMNPQPTGSPFQSPPPQQPGGFQSMVPQPTGFQPPFASQAPAQQAQPTGSVNNFLPGALQPQRTGPSSFASQTFGQAPPPPVPPIPQQPTIQPLRPQKTGPAPPIRFGVSAEAKRLTPQPTGRRANLSQATPQNPFGF
ncbi:MAG: hypothetical protein M1819_004648 [Sarea resinae]|nr:MAG: hypothetical protein M1819_004648 [Sarea resinae]